MTGNINSATIGIQDASGTNALLIGVNNDFAHNELAVNIHPKPIWLNVSSLSNSIIPGESDNLNLEINTLNISAGNYNYTLEIESNDFHNPVIEIPINLIVNDLPCDGVSPGDLNYDGQFDVLDIILAVNVILYGSTDECDAILSDLNNDSEINVLDIVSIINLILD